jgi:hypothetical protein
MIGAGRNSGDKHLCSIATKNERRVTPRAGDRGNPTFDEFISAGGSRKIFRPICTPDGIMGIGPDAKPQGACMCFDCKQFSYAGAVVGKGIDPREAEGEHLRLRPCWRRGLHAQLAELPAITITSGRALQQTNPLADDKCCKGISRFDAERPIRDAGTIQTELRRLYARKTQVQAVVEQNCIAIGHGGRHAADAFGQSGAARLGKGTGRVCK